MVLAFQQGQRSFLEWMLLVDQMPLCVQASASVCFASAASGALSRSPPLGSLGCCVYMCRDPAFSPEVALGQGLMRVGEVKLHFFAWN